MFCFVYLFPVGPVPVYWLNNFKFDRLALADVRISLSLSLKSLCPIHTENNFFRLDAEMVTPNKHV